MLDKLKVLLGLADNTKDQLLNILIDQATEEAVNYTHDKNADNLFSVISQMVVFKYNRLGSEGVDSETYSGVRFDYATDYPKSIMRQLNAKRRVMTID